MREIKYRAWDIKEEQMIDVTVLDLCVGILHTSSYDAKDGSTKNGGILQDYVIQQYTGIIDKNGISVCEGDLVNFTLPGSTHGPETEQYTNEEVWWDEDSAGYVFGKTYYDGWHGYHAYEVKNIEVVGNIYESRN